MGEYDGAQSSASAGRALLGNALLLVWMVTAANAIVLQRPLLRRPWFSSLTLSALVLGIAALLLALVTVPWITAAGGAGALALRSSLARGAACYCVAYYVLVNWGDAYMVSLSLPPSTVALGLTLEPLFTALLEWACFRDVMTLGQVAGAACTCLGLVVVVADLRAPSSDDDEAGGSRTPRTPRRGLPGPCGLLMRPCPSAEATQRRSRYVPRARALGFGEALQSSFLTKGQRG